MTDYPYTRPDVRCSVGGCPHIGKTLDLYHGRRCGVHRPRYAPRVAAHLEERGWPDTAKAFMRTWDQ